MSSVFGKIFRAATWGESHGPAVGCVVDGCPSNLELTEADVQKELDKRKPGQSDLTTSRGESDTVKILSGVFEGRTLGTPISMMVENRDADPSSYEELIGKPRPGHADYTYMAKYGNVDWRGGGRASARETIGRVAAGAVAGKLLETRGINVIAYTKQIGAVESKELLDSSMKGIQDLIYSNPARTIDASVAKDMEEQVMVARAQKDSVGGVVECAAFNVPQGLGEPVFDKISADLGKAVLSIPACKGVEFGRGFEFAQMRGSESNDEFILNDKKVSTKTNNCGGILGGMTDGMPIVFRCVFKPTASIGKKQKTVDVNTLSGAEIQVEGRHDPCIVPRAVPVVEAMAKLVLADHGLISGFIPRRL